MEAAILNLVVNAKDAMKDDADRRQMTGRHGN